MVLRLVAGGVGGGSGVEQGVDGLVGETPADAQDDWPGDDDRGEPDRRTRSQGTEKRSPAKKWRPGRALTANEAHMSVAEVRPKSAASASERCSRAIRPRVRERAKSTPMENSSTENGQSEGWSARWWWKTMGRRASVTIQMQEPSMMKVSTKAESDSILPCP